MKKLVVGLFAVCAAVSAQAAYVDWQYEGSNAKNDTSWGTSTSEAANGYTAYLLTAAAWDSIKTTATGQSDIASKALDSSTLIYERTAKSKSYYTTHADGATVPGVRAATVANKTDNYYVILANDDGFSIVVNNASITGYDNITQSGSGLTPGATLSGQDNAAMITAVNQAYPGGGSGGGVPEPTSGLLLLVGAGMLALRRKQK